MYQFLFLIKSVKNEQSQAGRQAWTCSSGHKFKCMHLVSGHLGLIPSSPTPASSFLLLQGPGGSNSQDSTTGFLPPTWETCIELSALSFGPFTGLSHPLPALVGVVVGWGRMLTSLKFLYYCQVLNRSDVL